MELASYAAHAVRLVNGEDAAAPAASASSPRGRLRAVFEAAADGRAEEAAARLNTLLRDFPVTPQLTDHRSPGAWHLHLADPAAGRSAQEAAVAAMGLAVFVTERGIGRLGVCAAAGCRDVYLDTSSNGSRRYCSDRCATRANVAAYRARRRSASASSPSAPSDSASISPADSREGRGQ
ncbi:hypothetical protein BIV57_21125 [Mangrovactinospora gilvigrisea]|uniref:Zinc finger CGNR domain-containing protein n=1 Tax=Mangrovactinospora gilvigrisea TaxID=1428644 RepID=A0A1J7BA77_9ACTN|nr:CGNR zinc finger domain-containing protein [Mangrovactinospora gilvigrisea]OIV35501.1 hypothetical protein BIV57_21125 [Mangrovactinospora gilvigrisea]